MAGEIYTWKEGLFLKFGERSTKNKSRIFLNTKATKDVEQFLKQFKERREGAV